MARSNVSLIAVAIAGLRSSEWATDGNENTAHNNRPQRKETQVVNVAFCPTFSLIAANTGPFLIEDNGTWRNLTYERSIGNHPRSKTNGISVISARPGRVLHFQIASCDWGISFVRPIRIAAKELHLVRLRSQCIRWAIQLDLVNLNRYILRCSAARESIDLTIDGNVRHGPQMTEDIGGFFRSNG